MDQNEARLYRNFLDLREPRFAPLIEYLKAKRASTEKLLLKGGDLQTLFRAQGEATVLDDLLDSVARAPEIIKRTRP